jgi:hypothetical protein
VCVFCCSEPQDRFRIAGYPADVDLHHITESRALSLIGEALYLPCIGSLMYSLYLNERNDWWKQQGNLVFASPRAALDIETDVLPNIGSQAEGYQAVAKTSHTKRRRLGGV